MRDFWRRLRSDWDAGLGEPIGSYWRAYGRWHALAFSPVLWAALILAIACYPLWIKESWASTALSLLPNLLGFSIGAMAIVLAFPTTKMFKILAEGEDESYYLDLASKLLHFIFVQVVAILLALLTDAHEYRTLSFLTFWAFSYAILTAAATALALFSMAQVYNHPGAHEDDSSN